MLFKIHRHDTLIPIAASACAFALLTGCSSGSGASSPVAEPQSAKTMYVVNYAEDANNGYAPTDSILGYSTSAPGSSTPDTTLNLTEGFGVDSIATGPSGELYVAGAQNEGASDSILVFAPGATGFATPTKTINGSASASNGTFTYADYMAVNSKGQLFVFSDDYTAEVFAPSATGNATPTQYLTWGAQNDKFDDIYDIAADGKGELFISDYGNNVIYAFAAGATGNVPPVRTITGTNVDNFSSMWSMTADDAGNLYTVNWNSTDEPNPDARGRSLKPLVKHRLHANSRNKIPSSHPNAVYGNLPTEIIVFPAGANSNATPTLTIGGSATGIIYPSSIAVDAAANIYYVDDFVEGGGPLLKFSVQSTGNVAPALNIDLTSLTGLGWGELAVY